MTSRPGPDGEKSAYLGAVEFALATSIYVGS